MTKQYAMRIVVMVMMALCGTAAWAADGGGAITQKTDSVKQLEKWEIISDDLKINLKAKIKMINKYLKQR